MPADLRDAVDQIVEALAPESWPDRFLTLFGLLCEKLETRTDPDPSLLLQQWAGIVTGVLEHLPPDASVTECLALMSISFNDQWRAQAIAHIDRDPTALDRLNSAILYGTKSWKALQRRTGSGRLGGNARPGAGKWSPGRSAAEYECPPTAANRPALQRACRRLQA